MTPLTRSSAPSTPEKSRADSAPETPTSATARRTPHCKKCHRPRAGHPRSGCPYIDAPDQSPVAAKAAQVAPSVDDEFSEELSSLHIVSPTEERRRASMPRSGNKLQRRLSVRFALVPEQTLASLTSTDAQLVEQLLKPGMMSDDVSSQDKVTHVLEWRKTLDDPDTMDIKEEPVEAKEEPVSGDSVTIAPLSRRMPCTLLTPSASQATTEPATDHGIGGSALDMNETVYLLPDARKAQPLGRSMSFEQRALFLHQLSRSSSMAPATLLSLPTADLASVQSDAEKVGFHVRVLPGGEENNKWVVLGTEEEAIGVLERKFLEEEKRSVRAKGKGGKLTAVAGGVVFGAVATWTSLAFS